ncbi:hypothetical protein AHiyo8_24760 [Arthrobacter sp. Hiyo8]|nr:hypothetical protein AHiyo8_24760 [Arthrobacter sp. Hiyo8]
MAGLVDQGAPILSLVEVRNLIVKQDTLTGAVPLTNDQVYFAGLGK